LSFLPERCDPTDKWSPTTCIDTLPVEIANNDVYTPDFIIPRGIGYYHKVRCERRGGEGEGKREKSGRDGGRENRERGGKREGRADAQRHAQRDREIDDESRGDRARAPGSFSKRPAHNSVGWVWGQSTPTDFEHGDHEDENITTGIGYYTPDKVMCNVQTRNEPTEHILHRQNTYITHSTYREHILHVKNTYRTICI